MGSLTRVVLFCSTFKGRRLDNRRASCGRALPSTEASAIQQTGIEAIIDRLADFDFFEIAMVGI